MPTYVHNGRFDPGVGARQLKDEGCTIAIPAFEMLWMAVLDHPDFDLDALPDLRIVFNVGVPERLRQLQERVPGAIQVSGFGSTEASSFMTLGEVTDSLDDRVNTNRSAAPGTARQDRESRDRRRVRSWWRSARSCTRAGRCSTGYYNDAERNAEVFDDEGFFHSGDLGSMDADGRMRFQGRLKDMLKVGGENVAAAEVEGFLLQHDAVAVVQVWWQHPDARYTEVGAAYVQLKPGAGGNRTGSSSISASDPSRPSRCRGMSALSTTGRCRARRSRSTSLRDWIAAELEAAGITEAPRLSSHSSA